MSEVAAVQKYVTQRVLDEHTNWHMRNMDRGSPAYGKKFLNFHRKYIGKFDKWRVARGYSHLKVWDPATRIPKDIPHANRRTNFPDWPLPSWATKAGGTTSAPMFGYRSLGEFKSEDELGNALDAPGLSYHGGVHVAIGGDMATPARAPKDPVFWRYHKFIDDVRSKLDGLLKPPRRARRRRAEREVPVTPIRG